MSEKAKVKIKAMNTPKLTMTFDDGEKAKIDTLLNTLKKLKRAGIIFVEFNVEKPTVWR